LLTQYFRIYYPSGRLCRTCAACRSTSQKRTSIVATIVLPFSTPLQDLRGVQIHPTEAIHLALSLPHVQLVLDSAAQHWNHDGYHGSATGLTGVEWDEWPAAEDGQQ